MIPKWNKSHSKKNRKEDKKICDEEASKKVKGARVNNDIKACAVHLVDIHPKNSARAVALSLKLEPRTVQRWYKTWKEDPDSLCKTIGRPRIIEPEGELAEATRNVVADLYFKQPTSTIDQLMDRLNSSFSELTISKRTLYRYMADLWIFSLKRVQLEPEERNAPGKIQARKEWVEEAIAMGVDYMNNCVFIDETGFNANLRRTQGWAPVGETPKVKVLMARDNSISMLGATYPKGLYQNLPEKANTTRKFQEKKANGRCEKANKGNKYQSLCKLRQ